MRPRQACLGIRVAPVLRPNSPGHSFNEAEASLPRNTVDGDFFKVARVLASMRPRQACLGIPRAAIELPRANTRGFNEAEASLPRNTGSVQAVAGLIEDASMRPRQACLGIPPAVTYPIADYVAASMRPRQACLGIPSTRRIFAIVSRCFNEAEASLPRNTTDKNVGLPSWSSLQ